MSHWSARPPYSAWLYVCLKHWWMSNQMPCPDGDGITNRK